MNKKKQPSADLPLIVLCLLLVGAACLTYCEAVQTKGEAYELVRDNCFIGQPIRFQVINDGNNTSAESDEWVRRPRPE